MNRGFKKQLDRARDKTAYICPICDKPTAFSTAEIAYPSCDGNSTRSFSAIANGRYRWKCSHCGTWHRTGAKNPIK